MAFIEKESNPVQDFPPVIVVMGVCGSGKSLVGSLLAKRLNYAFADADDFHSPANIEKMRAGHPLDDNDRLPWLNTLAQLISDAIRKNHRIVLACSALKQAYRDVLQGKFDRTNQIRFVYLKGSYELFQQRLSKREDHFMNTSMLQSQFAALEEPHEAVVVDAFSSAEEIIDACLAALCSNLQ